MATRVALGMSGGVDSSVAAVLLLRAGYQVVGVTCDFTGDEAAFGAACADAAQVCAALGISHVAWDCRHVFENEVRGPFCKAYAEGLTPSPCVGCNATVKFPQLWAAAQSQGCDAIATGHYARMVNLPDGGVALKTALDCNKDQSYMLAQVPAELLERLLLPLGGMTKPDVRRMAAELGFASAEKPESQDICFAPDGYRALLASRGVVAAPGPIADLRGKILGTHTGLIDYTPGQRQGLGIGGAPEPYYVIGKDAATNTLTVGFKADACMGGALLARPVWYHRDCAPAEAMVKLRYRSYPAACVLEELGEPAGEAGLRLRLRSAQPLTAPGQYAVFYHGDTVVGSAMISAILPADAAVQDDGEDATRAASRTRDGWTAPVL